MVTKQWTLKERAPQEFRKQFPEFSPLVGDLLWQGGLHTQEQIDEFFSPDYEQDLHDPFLFKDMEKGVERIMRALEAREKVTIYGDYDTDGVCGSTILHNTLKALGGDDFPVSVYIPDRAKEGYGLNMKALGEIEKDDTKLIITVDCGTTNISEVAYAQEKGIDVIVTDHHQVLDVPPPAYAFINAHQKEDTYPFKHLAGTGVAFKVACALIEKSRKDGWPALRSFSEGGEKWFLDLVALATVADMMPLLGENRTLVRWGLYVLAQQHRVGLRALMKEARVSPSVDTVLHKTDMKPSTIGFTLAPRLNAAGRMDHANTAFYLLNIKDPAEADRIAAELEETNKRRQDMVKKITTEAVARQEEWSDASVIFVGSKGWVVGVLGLVANKLVERFGKPAFVYEIQAEGPGRAEGPDEGGKTILGSARSPQGFNLVEAMGSAKEHLIRFGGHPQAGGFSATLENAENVKNALEEYAKKVYAKGIPPLELLIDVEVSSQELTWQLFEELEQFDPYGQANHKPFFVIRGMKVEEMRGIGKDKNHALFRLCDNEGKCWKALAFRAADREDIPQAGAIIDVVFELDIDEWNGNRELMLKVIDFKAHE